MLDRRRADDRVDDARELDEKAIARGLDDPAAVPGDRGVEKIAAQGFEGTQRADLVRAHEAAVADDIRRENGGEPPLGGHWVQGRFRSLRVLNERGFGGESGLCRELPWTRDLGRKAKFGLAKGRSSRAARGRAVYGR